MSKFVVILFCGLLLFVAGCVAPSEEGSTPMQWTDTNSVVEPTSVVSRSATWQPIPTQANTNPLAVRTNLVIRTNWPGARTNLARPAKPPIIYAFTSLSRWAATQRLHPPLLLAKSPLATYSISSSNGVMLLAIGSREATWNGITFHLGFAPELIDGDVCVHGLDLRKSLEPLLTDSPLSFPGTNRVIVIDPGHGGINAGSLSTHDGHMEKEFTLDWALRLVPLLVSNGWAVYLTRTTDVDLSLSNRVAVAEAHHADLFISLHFNSATDGTSESGLETYCLTPQGMPSTLTRGNPDFLSQWYPNNDFDGQNLQLAMRLHAAVLHASGEEDRGVRRARFMGVLHGHHRPAILIEGGFLSNHTEADNIESGAFRQKLAEAVANALR